MTAFGRLWRGELPLSQAFWNFAVIGAFIVNLSTSVMFLALLMNDYTIAAFIAGYAISVPYNIMVAVGVWRSANRYQGDRRWADLARVVTIASMVILSLT